MQINLIWVWTTTQQKFRKYNNKKSKRQNSLKPASENFIELKQA